MFFPCAVLLRQARITRKEKAFCFAKLSRNSAEYGKRMCSLKISFRCSFKFKCALAAKAASPIVRRRYERGRMNEGASFKGSCNENVSRALCTTLKAVII